MDNGRGDGGRERKERRDGGGERKEKRDEGESRCNNLGLIPALSGARVYFLFFIFFEPEKERDVKKEMW